MTIAQLRKSVLGLLAYLLVSNTSATEKRADPQHQAIGSLRPGELIDVRFQLLRVAAEIDGLAHESALHADIRIIGADLVGFRAREAGDAVRVADAEALIDFWIEPEFGAFPQSQAGE